MTTGTLSGQGSRAQSHLAFAAYLVAYVAAFGVTLYRLTGIWAGDGTFQYGFLILPISAFLIWSRRKAMERIDFQPSAMGAIVVIGFSLLWAIGELIGVQMLQQFAVIALLPAGVLAIYGWSTFRALLFPLAYLFFAFPWPVDRLTLVLQHVTAQISVHVLQATGFVTYLNGVLIETPVAVWHVADACSGIKFFLAALALGALYAHLFYRSWRRRAVFMVLAFIVPIVANGLRVYFTVVIGEVFGVEYATGTDHMVFGWQFFGTVLFLFFLAGWPWREEDGAVQEKFYASFGQARRTLFGFFAVALLISGPLLGAILTRLGERPVTAQTNLAPQIGHWRMILPDANPLGAHYGDADGHGKATYGNGSDQVNLVTAVYFGRPRHRHKLFTAGNRWFDPAIWQQTASNAIAQADLPHTLHEAVLSGGGARRLVWYGYDVGGHPVTSVIGVKLRQLWDSLRGRPIVTEAIVISTPLGQDTRQAAQVLSDFWRAYQAWLSHAPKADRAP